MFGLHIQIHHKLSPPSSPLLPKKKSQMKKTNLRFEYLYKTCWLIKTNEENKEIKFELNFENFGIYFGAFKNFYLNDYDDFDEINRILRENESLYTLELSNLLSKLIEIFNKNIIKDIIKRNETKKIIDQFCEIDEY